MRQEGADAVQDAHQVDIEHPSPIVERDVVDAAGGGDTGIVANHMDIPECLKCGVGRVLDADGVGDVTGDAAYVGPEAVQAFNRGGQCAGLDIG